MAAWVVNCPTSQNPEQVTKIIDQMQNRVRENEEVTSSLFVFHPRQYRKFGSESLLFQSLYIVWKQILFS